MLIVIVGFQVVRKSPFQSALSLHQANVQRLPSKYGYSLSNEYYVNLYPVKTIKP